jgi:hypothetical protein
MSATAEDLVKKFVLDIDFRNHVNSLPDFHAKRAYLDSQGFKGIHGKDVLPVVYQATRDISDADLTSAAANSAQSANDTITTLTTTTIVFAGASAAAAAT